MKKEKIFAILIPTLALFVICLVSAFLLAGTNMLTAERIEENVRAQAEAKRKIVFSNAESFGEEKEITVGEKVVTYNEAFDEKGESIGYVFISTSKGYGGDVTVMTSIDFTGNVIKSAVLLMDDETPGLGQNAGKDGFLKQFENKRGEFALTKNGGDIQAVTSATFTSSAVVECVNDAMKAYKQIGGAANG